MSKKLKEALAQPAQELAIPSTQDAASKVGPFWQEFSVVYEAIGRQQITIREIAWRCFLAAKITTQPAQEPVAWMYPDALCDRACLYACTKAFTQFPECATAPPQPAQKPVAWLHPVNKTCVTTDPTAYARGIPLYTTPPQPAQEPVAVLFQDGSIVKLEDLEFVPEKSGQRVQMLCTAPQQRPWLKPTDNEWFEWWRVSKVADETEAEIDFADFLIIAQAVVAKLKEKNNGT